MDLEKISEKTGLKSTLLTDLIERAKKHHVQKLILFGSRAKGSFKERSDIDLFVEAENWAAFMDDVDEHAPTLLIFDFSCDQRASRQFKEEVYHTGVILYEEI